MSRPRCTISRLVVCDPRKAALLKEGNKSDRIDARKLAELLRTNQVRPVYHGEHGIRTLKELGRSYLTVSKEITRTMAQIQQTLHMMSLPTGTPLTSNVARELCQRTGSMAVLDGSITTLGTQYVLGIKAVNCVSGEILAEEQTTANTKKQVLKVLNEAATRLRLKLGESLATMRRFDTPIEQATTPSLEALQAYSLGMKAVKIKSDFLPAVGFFKRATSLDQNFAAAYGGLALSYWCLGQTDLAAENARRAFELRDRVTDPEKFLIEVYYHEYFTGNLERNLQTCEVWAQTYPRDDNPRGIRIGIYWVLGQYDRALDEAQANLRLAPAIAIGYGGLMYSYIALNLLEDAQAAAAQALAKNLDSLSCAMTCMISSFCKKMLVQLRSK